MSIAALQVYGTFILYLNFDSIEEKMDYLNSIKKYILSLINYETFKSGNACMIILREYFELYSQFDELYIEGLKIFEILK